MVSEPDDELRTAILARDEAAPIILIGFQALNNPFEP